MVALTAKSGGPDDNDAQGGHLVVQSSITARQGKGADSDANGLVVQTIRGGQVTHSLTSEGADASEDGTGRGTPIISLAVAGDFSSSEDIAQTIRAAHGQPGVVAIDLRNAARQSGNGAGTQGDGIREDGPSYALSATERALPGVSYDTIVRRLSPLECERLQGYPDGWTEGQSDSARYRQMGNSLAVPVVEWIARRVVAVDKAAS